MYSRFFYTLTNDYILEQNPDQFIENDPTPRIVGTRSRDYAPRALPDLFEWENEGQTVPSNSPQASQNP